MTFSAFEGICPTCNRGQEMESPKDLCACGQYKYFYQAKCAMCATQALTPSPVAVDAKLLDLLSYIHRDGGQYTQEHGAEKSFSDAINIICEWRDKPTDTAPKPDSKQVKGLVEALEDAKTSMLDSGYAADCTSIKKINEALKTFKGEA